MNLKRKIDVLQEKRKELNTYQTKFNSAVSLVNDTIHNLSELNKDITQKIAEIEDYQKELAETRDELDNAKSKNEKVIRNFSALLGID